MSLLHEAARDALDAIPNLDVLPTGKERDRLFAAFQRLTLLATRALDENTAHRKPDRSALLRMAGNIAGGMVACPWAPNCGASSGSVPAEISATARQQIADASVDIARRILANVDTER